MIKELGNSKFKDLRNLRLKKKKSKVDLYMIPQKRKDLRFIEVFITRYLKLRVQELLQIHTRLRGLLRINSKQIKVIPVILKKIEP